MSGIIHGKAESHRRDQTKEISPTIIIGLGGTGKEALLRLRQRFLEKYDTVGFPAIGYLWIDTDMRDINIDGKPIDYLDQEARFAPVDCIDAQVPGNIFQTYFNNMNQNQHIFSWMYHSVSKLGSVMNGARRIRPLGRLGFFHSFNTIQQRLANIKTRITSQQARDQTLKNYGIKINPAEIKVIICCSLAGGTGSGMFLDCAFLVRHLFKDESPDIVGYLLLPPVFSPVIENNEEIYANCFAALKELEFYSMRKDFLGPEIGHVQTYTSDSEFSDTRKVSAHNFMVDWLNRGRPAGENGGGIVGPPFNTCYLVNNQTQTGGNIGPENKGDLIDMIAETIFIDFSTQAFSDKKRTIRSNLDDYLKNELEYEYLEGTNIIHSEIFSFRFSTFGLSMMYIPTDRVRKACAYLLGRDLIASWLKHNDVPGTLEEEIRKNVLGKLKLRVSRVADDFMAELQKNDDTGRTFFQEISTSWGEKEKAALRARIRSKSPNLMSEIERRKQAYAQSKLDRPKEKENWGAFVRRLELVNRKKFLESAQDFIMGAVKEWLDKDNMRFQATIEYLQVITVILKKHKEFFDNMSQKVKNNSEMIAKEIDALKSAIDDEENGMLGPHRWSLKALVDEICEKVALYFQEGIRSMIFQTAAEICDELRNHIGSQTVHQQSNGSEVVVREGLIYQLWQLASDLEEMQNDLQAKLNSYEQTQPHLVFENLYTRGMFKDYYYNQQSDGSKTPIVLNEMEALYKNFAGIESIYDIRNRINNVGLGNVQKELEEFAIQRFKKLNIDADVIKILYKKYANDHGMLNDTVERLVRNGTVWMRPSSKAMTERSITENYEDTALIGMNLAGRIHDDYQKFEKKVITLAQAANFRSPIGMPVDINQDTVFFYSEYAGIPLLYINDIEKYKEAYIHMARKEYQLHIDRNEDKFVDILIKKPEEVQGTIRINQILFVGSILRILSVYSGGDGTVSYQYYDRTTWQTIPLGNQYVALETLRQDGNRLKRIEAEVNSVRDGLTLPTRQRFFAILKYYITDGSISGIPVGPYSPSHITIGSVSREKLCPEYRAISRVIDEEEDRLLIQMNCDKETLKELFCELYGRLNDFSEEIPFGNRVHHILKGNFLEAQMGRS